MVLDQDTGSARLTAIPENVRDHFSKKTLNGEEAARAFATAQGLDWDSLSPERRVGLLKAGVQGMPNGLDAETRGKLTKDDMADFADWQRQAGELGWKHETIVTQGPQMPEIPPSSASSRPMANSCHGSRRTSTAAPWSRSMRPAPPRRAA